MPKGSVPEHLATCRACGQEFLTTRCGKAAFYCRRPVCDEQRARTGFTIANTGIRSRSVTPDQLIERRERDRDRFERQWRREVERWIVALQRQREVAARREAREQAVAEKRAARLAEREARRRARTEEAAARRRDQHVARARKLSDQIEGLLRELRRLERVTGLDLGAQRLAAGALISAAAAAASVRATDDDEPRGDITFLLARVRDLIVDRPDLPVPGRKAIQHAVVRLAHATGLTDTHDALRLLASEALAWDLALPQKISVTDIDTQAMRDAA